MGVGAHPRVSGENDNCLILVGGQGGSSPRERGKLLGRVNSRQSTRLIPA